MLGVTYGRLDQIKAAYFGVKSSAQSSPSPAKKPRSTTGLTLRLPSRTQIQTRANVKKAGNTSEPITTRAKGKTRQARANTDQNENKKGNAANDDDKEDEERDKVVHVGDGPNDAPVQSGGNDEEGEQVVHVGGGVNGGLIQGGGNNEDNEGEQEEGDENVEVLGGGDDVQYRSQINDVHTQAGDDEDHEADQGEDQRDIHVGTWFGQYFEDACKSGFFRELDISHEFLSAHQKFRAILSKAGYPEEARKECDDLLAKLRSQADLALERAYEHMPPNRGLLHPLTIGEWRAEVSEKVEKRKQALNELSRATFP